MKELQNIAREYAIQKYSISKEIEMFKNFMDTIA